MIDTSKSCSFSLLFGRILLSIIFILSGANKLTDYAGTAAYMASKGMTMIPFFLIAAALIELVGGLSLLFGFKARIGAGLLMFYLIPVSWIFHDFWNLEDPARQMQMIAFLKNVAIFGGLLYVVGAGPGKFSIDRCCGSSSSGCCPTKRI